MSTIRDAIAWGKACLIEASESARLDAELLLCYVLGCDRTHLYVHSDRELENAVKERFESIVYRRKKGEPVAYIVGKKEFFGAEFEVNRHVLIPRPDTEKLVEVALEMLPIGNMSRVIDVCTGSGCIAVALAIARKNTRIIATDISDEALLVARQNIERHHVQDRVELRQGNLLLPCADLKEIDLIVANPPYIKPDAMEDLPKDVRDFEPALALLGMGKNGLTHHLQIIEKGQQLLKIGGSMILEIGYDQKPDMEAFGFTNLSLPQFIKDDAGHNRLVCYRKLH